MAGFFSSGFFRGMGGHQDMDEEEVEKKEVDNKKLYEILEVDPKATEQQIRSSYKKLVLKHHPDKGGDPDKIKEINLAYEILSNSEKRELYDRYGLEGVRNGGGGGGGGFEDLFDILGGGGRKKNRGGQREKPKMKPTGKEISVKLEDIFTGKMLEINHKKTVLCEECSGTGGTGVKQCKDCDGQGAVIKTVQIGPGMYQRAQMACPKCQGKGEIVDPANVCKTCKSKKTAQVDKKVQISIEPGTPDEHIVKMLGEGDEHPDAQTGDLMVKINVAKHPIYERKGADLLLQKQITLKEALLGFTFNIPFLDGKKITISSLPGEVTTHGDVKTVKGKGLPFYKDIMNHGNLIVAFKVQFPDFKQLSQENRELLQKVLPGGNTGPADKGKNPEYLLDFDPADSNTNASGGNRKEEDDEEGERQGGGRQECVVQ